MNLRQHLLTLISVYATAKKLSPSRVTTLALGSGSMHRRLVEGKDINVGRFEASVAWFDAHWPDAALWPEGLPRPSLSGPARECAAVTLLAPEGPSSVSQADACDPPSPTPCAGEEKQGEAA